MVFEKKRGLYVVDLKVLFLLGWVRRINHALIIPASQPSPF